MMEKKWNIGIENTPLMWSIGSGADMMKRIAAPMIGGVFTSFVMELLVYPPIYKKY